VVKIYYDKDVTTNILKDKAVAVLGYGIQGRAQTLNLRDSGIKVIVGLPEKVDPTWDQAKEDGVDLRSVREASEKGDIIHMLTPDMVQPSTYEKEVKPSLTEGKALAFSHGFNIHFKQIAPPQNVDVIMVAPKSPGKRLRDMYVSGPGVPALVAVQQDYTGNAEKLALEMAKAIGCTRAGALMTTFKDETESDIIGEQTVLVGGIMELLKKGFEVLVEEGYPPELAYFEACNEAKLIMDLVYERGIMGMLYGVSETARFGGLAIGPKVIDERVKENMKKAAKDVKEGKFAQLWIDEYKQGSPNLKRLLKEMEEHQSEKVGLLVRKIAGIEK